MSENRDAGGIPVCLPPKRRVVRGALIALMLVIAAIAIFVMLRKSAMGPPPETIFHVKSNGHEIFVADAGDEHFLIRDGMIAAVVDQAGEPRLPYVNAAGIAGNFRGGPGTALVAGFGGGTIAMSFARMGWSVIAIDDDSLLVSVARRYFPFDSTAVRLSITDPRAFLDAGPDRFDVIVIDGVGRDAFPPRLATVEAISAAAERLRGDGVLVLNVESIGWDSPIVRALASTLRTKFSNVVALPTMEPPNAAGNVLLFARNAPLELPKELPVPVWRFSPEYDRAHAWDNRFEPASGAEPLTDKRCATDRWARAVKAAARAELKEIFAESKPR